MFLRPYVAYALNDTVGCIELNFIKSLLRVSKEMKYGIKYIGIILVGMNKRIKVMSCFAFLRLDDDILEDSDDFDLDEFDGLKLKDDLQNDVKEKRGKKNKQKSFHRIKQNNYCGNCQRKSHLYGAK